MNTLKTTLPAMIAYFLIQGLPLEGQPSPGEFRQIKEEIRINEEQKRYEDNLELIRNAQGRGYFFLIHPGLPQWEAYKDLEGFAGISEKDLEMRDRALEHSRTICEVDLPRGFDPGLKWPLCLIFHGGGSNMARVREHWHSEKLDEGFIKVWFRSYRHYDWDTFGWRSGDERAHHDVDSLFREILKTFPADTSRILAAGISAGGTFAFDLAFNRVIPLTGILAFCPGIPEGLNAQTQENREIPDLRAYIVGGENDYYLPGQKQLTGHMESWGLEYRHIIVQGMGHTYPEAEAGYIDKGLHFLTTGQ